MLVFVLFCGVSCREGVGVGVFFRMSSRVRVHLVVIVVVPSLPGLVERRRTVVVVASRGTDCEFI
jgi:hypothetical protein